MMIGITIKLIKRVNPLVLYNRTKPNNRNTYSQFPHGEINVSKNPINNSRSKDEFMRAYYEFAEGNYLADNTPQQLRKFKKISKFKQKFDTNI